MITIQLRRSRCPTTTTIRRMFRMIVLMAVACVAFRGPRVFHSSRPASRRLVNVGKDNIDASFRPYTMANVLLFGSKQLNSSRDSRVSYNVFGKVNQTNSSHDTRNAIRRRERIRRRKAGRKRRALKRAIKTILRSIQGKTPDLVLQTSNSTHDDMHAESRDLVGSTYDKISFYEELLKDSVVVTKDEINTVMGKYGKVPESYTSLRVFSTLDIDGDGRLTKSELPLLTGAEFSSLDTNRDGSIDRQELERGARSSLHSRTSQEHVEDAIEDTLGELEPLERQEFRLDGFDPYILVSVLTAEASFDVINEYQVEWQTILSQSSLSSLTTEDWCITILLFTASASTLVGIYAAVVFALTVLYGKTALGMERDEEYYAFLDDTGLQRFRAFKAFTASLALFCTVVVLELFQKSASVFWLPIAFGAAVFLGIGTTEYKTIMTAAAPIFSNQEWNPENTTEAKNDE